MDTVSLRGSLVTPTRRIKVCRDPDDDAFIEAALAGNAEFIVSGDEDLLSIRRFESIKIVTPKIFLASL